MRDGYIDQSEQPHRRSWAVNGGVLAITPRLGSVLCHPQCFLRIAVGRHEKPIFCMVADVRCSNRSFSTARILTGVYLNKYVVLYTLIHFIFVCEESDFTKIATLINFHNTL